MKTSAVRTWLIAIALVATCGIPGTAAAQVYPSRPVTMVVPFPAGGSTDTIGRVLADGMRASLGQTIIIENVGGASGNIGVGRVARAAPDGYTLILGSWPTHVLNAAIVRVMGTDLLTIRIDLDPSPRRPKVGAVAAWMTRGCRKLALPGRK